MGVDADRKLTIRIRSTRTANAYMCRRPLQRALGRPMSHFDGQMAAIARTHGGAVATRSTADFGHCEIDVINPWTFTPQA